MSGCRNKNDSDSAKVTKKPFNKKRWREQKYSCKAKVQKWENIKRKQAQKQYHGECRKLNSKSNLTDDFKLVKNKAFFTIKEAQLKFEETQKIKEQKRKEQEMIRKKKIEAIKAYKEKKAARFKKLSQKTRKGQPLMRGRIELMLEKIQTYVNNTT